MAFRHFLPLVRLPLPTLHRSFPHHRHSTHTPPLNQNLSLNFRPLTSVPKFLTTFSSSFSSSTHENSNPNPDQTSNQNPGNGGQNTKNGDQNTKDGDPNTEDGEPELEISEEELSFFKKFLEENPKIRDKLRSARETYANYQIASALVKDINQVYHVAEDFIRKIQGLPKETLEYLIKNMHEEMSNGFAAQQNEIQKLRADLNTSLQSVAEQSKCSFSYRKPKVEGMPTGRNGKGKNGKNGGNGEEKKKNGNGDHNEEDSYGEPLEDFF